MTLFARTWAATAAAALALSAAQPAAAAVAFFTDRASFDAAVAGAVDHDFNAVAVGPGDVSSEGPQSVDGVTFSSNGLSYVYGQTLVSDYGRNFYSGQSPSRNDPANTVFIDFGLGGLQAFGFTFGSFTSLDEAYRLTLNTGDFFDFATPAQFSSPNALTTGFLGFLSDAAPLTGATLVSQGGPGDFNGVLDIPTFVTAAPQVNSAVPEPSSWLTMIVGFALLGAAMRRRQALAVA